MRSQITDAIHGARAEILGCVERFPGAHLRGIERMTELPLGQLLYHLDRLERMGRVVSKRDAGFRRFYPTATVGREEKKYLAALRHEAARRILLALLEEGPLPHKALQERMGVAGSTLSFHLQRLLDSGVLARTRQGPLNVYAIQDADLARHEVVFWRESFQDEAVDRYVRRVLATLPALAARDGAGTRSLRPS